GALTIAASRPPEPAQVSIATSPFVPKKGFMPSRIRASIAANSGPRWLIIWRPPASRTEGGRAVGPGIRRLGSKRSTGSPGDEGAFVGGVDGRRTAAFPPPLAPVLLWTGPPSFGGPAPEPAMASTAISGRQGSIR